MRRRIQSESELKIKISKPPLVAHSRSLNLSCDSKILEMQLIGQEKDESSSNCTNSHPTKTSNMEMSPAATEPENLTLIPNIKDIPYNNGISCEPENIPLPRNSGRPTSLSSVTSSRTSRGSDYFSSSSAIESHPPVSGHNSGSHLEFHSEVADVESSSSRAVLNKVVESVQEEEEGFVDDNALASDPPEVKIKHFNNSSNKSESVRIRKIQKTFPEVHQIEEKETENLVSPKDINKKLSEVDYLSPIATLAMAANPNLSYVDRVIIELLETERMYVRALEDILAQYVIALKSAPAGMLLSDTDTENLFGNIKDIYVFNRKLLSCLENCDQDPVKIAQHFVSHDSAFSVYTTYCTNYPISVAILTRCMKNSVLAQFFKTQQELLGHNLPLGSYLLKPVQRILKYHLILQELVKNCDRTLNEYWIIEEALETMTNIARHINDMKRKHEDTVRVQEIQSLLSNWQGDDLTICGDIVMEGELRLQGAKNERLVFLFDKMIVITKRQDGFLVCKANIRCSDLTMLDGIKENPLSFRISHFDTPTSQSAHHGSKTGKEYTLVAKTMEEKLSWTHNIKKLMLKNHHAAIPLQAQQSILNMNAAGLDDPAGAEENHRVPLRRITSSLSSSTFANGKPRRRSDSASRKALPLRPWKRLEQELSDDVSSDSVPNTPTLSVAKPRFSFPRIIHSKSESTGDENKTGSEQIEKAKKEKRSDAAKNGKYKDSVVYRRHLRRISQPITDIEKRLSVRAPSDQEEQEEEKTKMKKSEVSLEDFESLEDFLNFNVENKRESLSWDLQIVEPFFEKLQQEKEQKEKERLAQRQSASIEPSILIPMPKRTRMISLTSCESSSDNECQKILKSSLKQTKPVTVSEEKTFPIQSFSSNEKQTVVPTIVDQSQTNPVSIPTVSNEVKNSVLAEDNRSFDAVQIPPQAYDKTKSTEESALKDEGTKKPEPLNSEPVQVPKLKRSLSTQVSHTDRRKYFDRLKEMRDRRHSQLALGSEAKAIQAGKVREMIEQHQEQMTSSHVQITGIAYKRRFSDKTTLTKKNDSARQASKNKSDSPPTNETPPTGTVVLRRPRTDPEPSDLTGDVNNPATDRYQPGSKKQNYRSMDLEIVDPSNRFSSLTTASLPLHFTSSSSGSGNEELSCSSPKAVPTYKAVLQSQMILTRSYSQETGSNTRRSTNLVIQASPEQKRWSLNTEKKFLFKDVGKIAVTENETTDKLSEEVDCVWHKLEVCDKCHSHQLHSPLTPRSSFSRKTRPSSLLETKKNQSQHLEVYTSKETTVNHLIEAKPHSTTSVKNYPNQTQSNAAKARVTDTNEDKTADLTSKDKRQGRTKERKPSASGETVPINVKQLAQKYNQLTAAANPSTTRPTYRRSQSAGARKHLSDLRFSSSSNPQEQINYDDVLKQARNNSKVQNRKSDRSVSPPRRRRLATAKNTKANKLTEKIRGRPLRATAAASLNDKIISEKTLEKPNLSTNPTTASDDLSGDGIISKRSKSPSSTLDLSSEKTENLLKTATSPTLVEMLCKPTFDVIKNNDDVTNDKGTTQNISPATTSHESICTSPSLVEELCKPSSIVIDDVTNCVQDELFLMDEEIEPMLNNVETNANTATSPTLMEELCKPFADVINVDDANSANESPNDKNSDFNPASPSQSDFIARFCKM